MFLSRLCFLRILGSWSCSCWRIFKSLSLRHQTKMGCIQKKQPIQNPLNLIFTQSQIVRHQTEFTILSENKWTHNLSNVYQFLSYFRSITVDYMIICIKYIVLNIESNITYPKCNRSWDLIGHSIIVLLVTTFLFKP